VIPGRDEEDGGGIRADPVQGQQAGSAGRYQRHDQLIEAAELAAGELGGQAGPRPPTLRPHHLKTTEAGPEALPTSSLPNTRGGQVSQKRELLHADCPALGGGCLMQSVAGEPDGGRQARCGRTETRKRTSGTAGTGAGSRVLCGMSLLLSPLPPCGR
jgi:hypothetical protein